MLFPVVKKIIFLSQNTHFLLTPDPNIDILIQSQRGFIFTGLWFWGLLKDESSFFVPFETSRAIPTREMPLPFRWEGGPSFLKGMTDFVPSLKPDKFSEFLFFEKEPSLQKKKSQDQNPLERTFTKDLPKAQQSFIFIENPFFQPLGKADKTWASRLLSPYVKFSIQI